MIQSFCHCVLETVKSDSIRTYGRKKKKKEIWLAFLRRAFKVDSFITTQNKKWNFDPARIRTWNPLIRSQMPYPLGHGAFCDNRLDFQSQETHLWLRYYFSGLKYLTFLGLHAMQLQWWPAQSSLRTQTYFCRIRPRSRTNIDQHYPKENCLEGNIIPCTFNMIICTSCIKIKRKELRTITRVLQFGNEITKLLFYLTKVMPYHFKENERLKLQRTTSPGLEFGIFCFEVRRLIH